MAEEHENGRVTLVASRSEGVMADCVQLEHRGFVSPLTKASRALLARRTRASVPPFTPDAVIHIALALECQGCKIARIIWDWKLAVSRV
jgi:hypothetical protein